jgi:hypothetical protein
MLLQEREKEREHQKVLLERKDNCHACQFFFGKIQIAPSNFQ